RRTVIVDDLESRLGAIDRGSWPEPARTAAVIPVARAAGDGDAPDALLVAGISPRRPFDDEYQGFVDLVGAQLSRAIERARAYDEERQRAEVLAELYREKTRLLEEARRAKAEVELKAEQLQQTAVELEMHGEELRAMSEELQEVNQRSSSPCISS